MKSKKTWEIISIIILGILLVASMVMLKEDMKIKKVTFRYDQEVAYISVMNGSTGKQMYFTGEEMSDLFDMIQGVKIEMPVDNEAGGYSYYIDVHYSNGEVGKRLTVKYTELEAVKEWLDSKYENYDIYQMTNILPVQFVDFQEEDHFEVSFSEDNNSRGEHGVVKFEGEDAKLMLAVLKALKVNYDETVDSRWEEQNTLIIRYFRGEEELAYIKFASPNETFMSQEYIIENPDLLNHIVNHYAFKEKHGDFDYKAFAEMFISAEYGRDMNRLRSSVSEKVFESIAETEGSLDCIIRVIIVNRYRDMIKLLATVSVQLNPDSVAVEFYELLRLEFINEKWVVTDFEKEKKRK